MGITTDYRYVGVNMEEVEELLARMMRTGRQSEPLPLMPYIRPETVDTAVKLSAAEEKRLRKMRRNAGLT